MTNEDIQVVGGLLYGEWSKAFDSLKRVKAEKDDGSVDWADFHEVRMLRAIQAEGDTLARKDRFVEEFRDILMKGFGF